jgi:hypothetical protein
LKQAARRPRCERIFAAVTLKLGDYSFVARDPLLALGDVPFGEFQTLFDNGPFHGRHRAGRRVTKGLSEAQGRVHGGKVRWRDKQVLGDLNRSRSLVLPPIQARLPTAPHSNQEGRW